MAETFTAVMAKDTVQAFHNATGVPPNCSINHDSLHTPLAVFYSLFFLLGLIGNVLAIWFLWQHSKKNSVHIFLINLALADLIFLTCLPFRIAYHVHHDILNSVFCRIVGCIFYMNMYVSIILLGLISIDRYLKLQRGSGKRSFVSGRTSVLICCILWVGAIVLITPYITLTGDKPSSHKCFHYKLLQNAKWKAYLNAVIVAGFWVVYGALVTSYVKIGKGLLRITGEKPDLPNATKYSRTARNSFFILFLFTICFVPYHLQRIFYIISQITNVPCQWTQILDKTNETALLLSAFNSCLDPVMYFVLCASVRRKVWQMLHSSTCVDAFGGISSSISTDGGRNQREVSTQSESSTLQRKTVTLLKTPDD